jgi:hypothetical protein
MNTMKNLSLAAVSIVLSLGTGSSLGCMDGMSALDEELSQASADFAWRASRVVDKGTLAWGTIATDAIVNSTSTAYYHAYRYAATKGRVTFTLEFAAPQGDGRGTWFYLADSSMRNLFQVRQATGTRAHFEYSFSWPATYYVVVRQHTPAAGSYPYSVGAEATTCTLVEYTHPYYPDYTLVRAEGFEPGGVGDPWAYFPDDPALAPGTSFTWRDAFLGPCDIDPTSDDNPMTSALCDATDPPVCGVTTMSGYLATNRCDFRDWVANDTDTPGSWVGTYSTDTSPCHLPAD